MWIKNKCKNRKNGKMVHFTSKFVKRHYLLLFIQCLSQLMSCLYSSSPHPPPPPPAPHDTHCSPHLFSSCVRSVFRSTHVSARLVTAPSNAGQFTECKICFPLSTTSNTLARSSASSVWSRLYLGDENGHTIQFLVMVNILDIHALSSHGK